jgi:hypothetical protein
MDLSIIIVSWRVKKLLEQCLTSLFKFLPTDFAYEIIVVDNASGDGTVEMVRENFKTVKLITLENNLGFAKANNLAIKQASGKFILLLNPDTEFLNDDLSKLLNTFENQKSAGILGCKLFNADQTIQPSVRRFPRTLDHLLMMFKLHHLFPLKHYLATGFDYNKSSVVDQVMGAFFLIKREVLEKVGALDEGYYIWFEEVDYCLRARIAGFETIYYPDFSVIHYGGQSFKQLKHLKQQWLFSCSRLRYLWKNENIATYLLILLLTPLSLFLSLLVDLKPND